MKIKLAFGGIALASLGVVAPAHADVTIYGILDTYVGIVNAGGVGPNTVMQSGGLYASRLAFKGDEDLGGGIKARFALDAGLSMNSGAQADANRFWGRQAWVDLLRPYGELRLGRQNSAQVLMLDNFDAFSGGTFTSVLNYTGTYSFRYYNAISYLSPE